MGGAGAGRFVATWGPVLLLACAAASAAARAGPLSQGADACGLLLDEEIRSVQRLEVVERVPSNHRSAGFDVRQCFYRTREQTSSVSLALTAPFEPGSDAARRYWKERFHPVDGFPSGKRKPPRRVDDLGEEAFWVGDGLTGALYVLSGDRFLRVSVGGVRDEALRRKRSATLARAALSRVATPAPPPAGR